PSPPAVAAAALSRAAPASPPPRRASARETTEDPDEDASGGGGGGVSPSLGLREEKRRLPAARPSATVVETGALAKSAAMPLPLDPPPEGRGPPELMLPDAALAAAILSPPAAQPLA